jgi:hypothetical protein
MNLSGNIKIEILKLVLETLKEQKKEITSQNIDNLSWEIMKGYGKYLIF